MRLDLIKLVERENNVKLNKWRESSSTTHDAVDPKEKTFNLTLEWNLF